MKLETLEYKRLVRMSEVGATLVGRLPAFAGALLVRITLTVSASARLTALQASATGRASEMARGKAIARAAVRSDIEAIYRTAAVVALENPGFDERFRKGLLGDQKLLTAARAAVEDAAPLAAAFIQHAMPPDFLEASNAHIGNFERAAQEYAAASRACKSVTKEIEMTVEKGFPAVMAFDAIVRNALSNDTGAIAEWDRACQLGRKPVKRATPPPPDSSPGKEVTATPAAASV